MRVWTARAMSPCRMAEMISIAVTAQNGSVRTYTIHVVKQDGGPYPGQRRVTCIGGRGSLTVQSVRRQFRQQQAVQGRAAADRAVPGGPRSFRKRQRTRRKQCNHCRGAVLIKGKHYNPESGNKMIRRMRHAAAVLAMACVMTVMMPAQMITAFAANAKIAFFRPSATVGGQIKVNMKITSSDNLANADVMLSYDSNILELWTEPTRTEGQELSGPWGCGHPIREPLHLPSISMP